MYKTSEISESFRDLTFDNFVPDGRPRSVQAAYNVAKYYVARFDHVRKERKNSVAFLGKPGSGKTHLLIAMCNALLDRDVGVLYFPWVAGSNELRAEVRGDTGEVQRRLDGMKGVDVLFLDDLFKGRERPTPWQTEWLFDVVNDRYLHRRPILLSSERTFEDLIEIDEGIGSRLYEMTKSFSVEMRLAPGEQSELNYRLRKGGL